MFVTVAICTHNRADLLNETLASFRHLTIPNDLGWELLVIDNNCTDHTRYVVEAHQSYLPVRRIEESAPGLCAARNRAVSEAAGALIVFTDDDVIVSEPWLVEYVHAAVQWPEAAFFGGTVTPRFGALPPRWVLRNLDPLSEPYALANHGLDVRKADLRPIVGANMAFRTHVLRQHPFNTGVGQIGKGAVRGDETELLGRLRSHGLWGVWVGPATVQHYVSPERMKTAYLWHWYTGLGVALVRSEGISECARFMGAPRWALPQFVAAYSRYLWSCHKRDNSWVKKLRRAAVLKGLIEEYRRHPTTLSSNQDVQARWPV